MAAPMRTTLAHGTNAPLNASMRRLCAAANHVSAALVALMMLPGDVNAADGAVGPHAGRGVFDLVVRCAEEGFRNFDGNHSGENVSIWCEAVDGGAAGIGKKV